MPPVLRRGAPPRAGRHGPSNHPYIPPSSDGWTDVAVTMWELRQESFSDRHQHVELNFVIDGVLFVECDGVTVVGAPGDLIEVPAGSAGTYSAPDYARMLAIYGPNPEGLPGEVLGHRRTVGPPP